LAESCRPCPAAQWQGVVAVTAGAAFLCSLHRSTFAVLMPSLQQQYGLSLSQVGVLQTATLAAYLLGQLPSGRLADRLGGAR
jgi:ACS family glucarate transporter-like MFS transporter